MTAHPSLPGLLADGEGLSDVAASWPVTASEVVFDSPYLSLTVDTIRDAGGGEHRRSVVRPNGAVGVLAIDDDDRVLLVHQYRHPVARRMLELPAGTLDVTGEPPVVAAARELAEEADVVASEWSSLLTLRATPGYSSEQWEVFVATGLSAVPAGERTAREAEEADMQQWWMPFEDVLAAVLDGRISNALTAAAILGLQVRRGTRATTRGIDRASG